MKGSSKYPIKTRIKQMGKTNSIGIYFQNRKVNSCKKVSYTTGEIAQENLRRIVEQEWKPWVKKGYTLPILQMREMWLLASYLQTNNNTLLKENDTLLLFLSYSVFCYSVYIAKLLLAIMKQNENPYIRFHKLKMKNETHYEEGYLKWLQKKDSSGVPIEKAQSIEDLQCYEKN